MKILTALALLTLTGCASTQRFIDRHPVITAVALGSVIAIAAAMNGKHGTTAGEPDRQMSIPLTPNCNVYPEMCK